MVYRLQRLIHSLRNLSRPVHKLPLELFSQIIQRVPHENDTDTRSIVPLTHVCRRWREGIISTPQCWTLISSRSKGLAILSLQRTKGVPLQVSLDMDYIKETPWLSKAIAPYIQNIQTVHFSGICAVRDLGNAIPGFPQSTPHLRLLTLNKPWTRRSAESTIDLFESLAPVLECLKLAHIPLYPSFLRLRALRVFSLLSKSLNIHLDTLLDFLEENHSLERATLDIRFAKDSLCRSERGAPIINRLRCLSIGDPAAEAARALIPRIGLQRGAHLEILHNLDTWLCDVFPSIPTTQLSNLSLLTSMECRISSTTSIQLFGPSGSLSGESEYRPGRTFAVLSVLRDHLVNVREFRLIHETSWGHLPPQFDPTFFPALETFAVYREIMLSMLLSTMFSCPFSPPRLKTLAFSNCNLSGGFMEELAQYASNRKETGSAWLHRVVIVDSRAHLPSAVSIDALEKHVPIVDVCVGKALPRDLT